MENNKKQIKLITGQVAAISGDKTGKMVLSTIKKHPLYKKYMKRQKSLMFHDEKNECRVGDTIQVTETRPLSKSKRYRLVKIVDRAEG
jgi:small subunit ribosomal protein S17